MTKRASVFCTAILVAGCAGLTTAVAVAGTDRGSTATEEPEIGALTVSAATSIAAGMDGQSPGSRNERIELADGKSRFSGASLRKKDAPVAADGDKTNPSPDTSVDLRKKEASPNRSSGSEAPKQSDTTAAAPGATKEQAESTDGECPTNSADPQGGEAADTVKKVGKKPVGGETPKKKMKLGKKQVGGETPKKKAKLGKKSVGGETPKKKMKLGKKKKCKKAKSVAKKKKSKPLSSRDAEKKAQAGLKRVQGQTQSGLKEVIGNANRAAQAADKLAPEVKPSAVSEDHVDLGSSDDLGE